MHANDIIQRIVTDLIQIKAADFDTLYFDEIFQDFVLILDFIWTVVNFDTLHFDEIFAPWIFSFYSFHKNFLDNLSNLNHLAENSKILILTFDTWFHYFRSANLIGSKWKHFLSGEPISSLEAVL